MIISRTPLRISLLGGGSDYPVFYCEHIGMVLGFTISKYVYLTVQPHSLFSPNTFQIQNKAINAVLEYLDITDGAEVYYARDLPAQSGMGSSSAFVVGLLHALFSSGHVDWLAQVATYIEQDILKEPVGSQDQILTAYGGLNQIVWHPSGDRVVRPIELPQERLEEFHSHLMLFYVGPRQQDYTKNVELNHTDTLRRLANMAKDGVQILTDNYAMSDFGILLHDAWTLKKELSPTMSNPKIDDIYAAAISAGALGGKILGSGGGGFMLIFCEPQYQPKVYQVLSKLIHVPFNFEF